MVFVKSALVGLCAAVLTVIAGFVVAIVHEAAPNKALGIGVFWFYAPMVLGLGLVAFVGAFMWEFRRLAH